MSLLDMLVQRILGFSGKPELSPEEFKQFIYLLYETIASKPAEDGDLLYLPNKKNPTIRINLDRPGANYVDITILDGLGEDTGALISSKERDGRLGWYADATYIYYSPSLQRYVPLTNEWGLPPFSDTSLTPEECARVAKAIWEASSENRRR